MPLLDRLPREPAGTTSEGRFYTAREARNVPGWCEAVSRLG
ncbi:hypothetical protein ACFWZR_00930 [Streptomyces sp. NPDC059017]